MDSIARWVEKVVPPILIGAFLWEFMRLRIRKQNEPQGILRGYYLETTIFGNRSMHVIPFYIKNYRLHWGSSVDKFPLTKLPSLPFRRIIQFMERKEQVQLAITSKKTEEMIRSERMKVETYWVYIEDERSRVSVGRGDVSIFSGIESDMMVTWPSIGLIDVLPWLDLKLSTLENTIRIKCRCQSLYPNIPYFGLEFNTDHLPESTSVQDILNMPEFQNWDLIAVYGSKIAPEDLDLIMDRANEKRGLHLYLDESLPENYNHEKAFIFHDIAYSDATWITIHHVFTLRNNGEVLLGNEKLRCSLKFDELNTLIKHWVQCDYDMFRHLTVFMEQPSVEDVQNFFKDLAVVKVYRPPFCYQLIASLDNTTKKHPLLVVCFLKYGIQFSAYDPDETDETLERPWTREHHLLKMLTKIKLIGAEIAELELRVDDEDNVLRLGELREQRVGLEHQLTSHPVYYEDEMMLVVEEIVEGNEQ